MQTFYRSCQRIHLQMGLETLKEIGATQLEESELGGQELKGAQLFVVTMQRHPDASRHIGIDASVLLIQRLLKYVWRSVMQIFYSHIIRYAREIVLIHQADMPRQSEEHILANLVSSATLAVLPAARISALR